MSFKTNFVTNTKAISFFLRKHAPSILTGAGITLVTAGSVGLVKQTFKAVDIINEHNEISAQFDEAVGFESPDYTQEDYKDDKTKLALQTTGKLVKNYILPVTMMASGIACIVISDIKVNAKLAETTSALLGANKIINTIKKRTIDKYGKDMWEEIRYGVEKETITVEEEDPETGKKKKVKKTVKTVKDFDPNDPATYSKFAKFFDESCAEWDKDPEMNLLYLLSMQNTANEMLKCRGHLFLNEVYDMLGIKRTKEGQKYGWIFCDDNPCGDNYVDFGIYELDRPKNRDFVNGYENVILLDFNVDGPIVDMI